MTSETYLNLTTDYSTTAKTGKRLIRSKLLKLTDIATPQRHRKKTRTKSKDRSLSSIGDVMYYDPAYTDDISHLANPLRRSSCLGRTTTTTIIDNNNKIERNGGGGGCPSLTSTGMAMVVAETAVTAAATTNIRARMPDINRSLGRQNNIVRKFLRKSTHKQQQHANSSDEQLNNDNNNYDDDDADNDNDVDINFKRRGRSLERLIDNERAEIKRHKKKDKNLINKKRNLSLDNQLDNHGSDSDDFTINSSSYTAWHKHKTKQQQKAQQLTNDADEYNSNCDSSKESGPILADTTKMQIGRKILKGEIVRKSFNYYLLKEGLKTSKNHYGIKKTLLVNSINDNDNDEINDDDDDDDVVKKLKTRSEENIYEEILFRESSLSDEENCNQQIDELLKNNKQQLTTTTTTTTTSSTLSSLLTLPRHQQQKLLELLQQQHCITQEQQQPQQLEQQHIQKYHTNDICYNKMSMSQDSLSCTDCELCKLQCNKENCELCFLGNILELQRMGRTKQAYANVRQRLALQLDNNIKMPNNLTVDDVAINTVDRKEKKKISNNNNNNNNNMPAAHILEFQSYNPSNPGVYKIETTPVAITGEYNPILQFQQSSTTITTASATTTTLTTTTTTNKQTTMQQQQNYVAYMKAQQQQNIYQPQQQQQHYYYDTRNTNLAQLSTGGNMLPLITPPPLVRTRMISNMQQQHNQQQQSTYLLPNMNNMSMSVPRKTNKSSSSSDSLQQFYKYNTLTRLEAAQKSIPMDEQLTTYTPPPLRQPPLINAYSRPIGGSQILLDTMDNNNVMDVSSFHKSDSRSSILSEYSLISNDNAHRYLPRYRYGSGFYGMRSEMSMSSLGDSLYSPYDNVQRRNFGSSESCHFAFECRRCSLDSAGIIDNKCNYSDTYRHCECTPSCGGGGGSIATNSDIDGIYGSVAGVTIGIPRKTAAGTLPSGNLSPDDYQQAEYKKHQMQKEAQLEMELKMKQHKYAQDFFKHVNDVKRSLQQHNKPDIDASLEYSLTAAKNRMKNTVQKESRPISSYVDDINLAIPMTIEAIATLPTTVINNFMPKAAPRYSLAAGNATIDNTIQHTGAIPKTLITNVITTTSTTTEMITSNATTNNKRTNNHRSDVSAPIPTPTSPATYSDIQEMRNNFVSSQDDTQSMEIVHKIPNDVMHFDTTTKTTPKTIQTAVLPIVAENQNDKIVTNIEYKSLTADDVTTNCKIMNNVNNNISSNLTTTKTNTTTTYNTNSILTDKTEVCNLNQTTVVQDEQQQQITRTTEDEDEFYDARSEVSNNSISITKTTTTTPTATTTIIKNDTKTISENSIINSSYTEKMPTITKPAVGYLLYLYILILYSMLL